MGRTARDLGCAIGRRGIFADLASFVRVPRSGPDPRTRQGDAMKPVRLDRLIREMDFGAIRLSASGQEMAALVHGEKSYILKQVQSGDIVTPADETLARMTPLALAVDDRRWVWDCCGRPTNPLNVPTRYDQHATECEWLKASIKVCLLYTSPSPRDRTRSRMPSSA